MSGWLHRERCGNCGRFVSEQAPGVSWSQSWSYGWDGVPDLHDRVYRCSPCTDQLGIRESNCNPAAGPWSGRNPLPSPTPSRTTQAQEPRS